MQDLNSLTRDRTHVPSIGSMTSWPLDHPASLTVRLFILSVPPAGKPSFPLTRLPLPYLPLLLHLVLGTGFTSLEPLWMHDLCPSIPPRHDPSVPLARKRLWELPSC